MVVQAGEDRERKPTCPLCPGPPAGEIQSQLHSGNKNISFPVVTLFFRVI